MKPILISFVALILLGGIAAGAYMYFKAPSEAVAAETEGGAHETGHGATNAYSYVQLDPLILPIVSKENVSQTFSLVVAIEVEGDANSEKIKQSAPRLVDAYISDLYGVLSRKAAMKGGVVQVDYLKKRLRIVTQRVVGSDVANDVLLQVVQQRRS